MTVDLMRAGLLLLSACAVPAPAGRDNHTTTGLVGVWQGAFTATPTSGATSGGPTSALGGDIVLFQSPWIERLYGIEDSTSLEGVYDLDFTPFGFEARPVGRVPLANGSLAGDLSVRIRLNPYVSQGAVVLEGVLHGDSVVGRWYYELPGGASGTFLLMRRHE